jgi:hypothetical protein
MNPKLKNLQRNKESLCKLRLKLASRNKTQPWTMAQLEVLNRLKKNKCRDPMGYANEILKNEVDGDALKKAILTLMDGIKFEQPFPEALEIFNISSIYKNKGSRNNFENYRRMFNIPIFRTILETLC